MTAALYGVFQSGRTSVLKKTMLKQIRVSFSPHFKRMNVAAFGLASLLIGCASPAPSTAQPGVNVAGHSTESGSDLLKKLNRITWGVSSSSIQAAENVGFERYLERQLHPGLDVLPSAVQSQISSMTISQQPLIQLVNSMEQRRKATDSIANDEEKKAAQQAYQQELNRLAKEAATRSLLRDLYSPNQLQEQMTWFWMNHFNVFQGKNNLRLMVGDYEEYAIRPHALGKFRDLLSATIHHPAMLRYLDNEQNSSGHINENYARELMELHTLGLDSGYSQRDVQELARILTGLGVNIGPNSPSVRRDLQAQYFRQGLFEFNPNRHDYGDKQFLGQVLRGRGLGELDEAIDRLSRNPATARFISRKLAAFFVADEPSTALVNQLAQTFQRTDGDIAATLNILFHSAEFNRSLGHEFKDPVHYVVSSVRFVYNERPILNSGPMLNWLSRMAEPLYGRQTPDGYPMNELAWASSGQMSTRFEIAKAIGSGSAGLFKTDSPQPQEQAAFPQLSNALYFQYLQKTLSAQTRQVLEQAGSSQEWNTFLLSSPEMMHR
jgi:uncharacterized protein (DUF1800 family)